MYIENRKTVESIVNQKVKRSNFPRDFLGYEFLRRTFSDFLLSLLGGIFLLKKTFLFCNWKVDDKDRTEIFLKNDQIWEIKLLKKGRDVVRYGSVGPHDEMPRQD